MIEFSWNVRVRLCFLQSSQKHLFSFLIAIIFLIAVHLPFVETTLLMRCKYCPLSFGSKLTVPCHHACIARAWYEFAFVWRYCKISGLKRTQSTLICFAIPAASCGCFSFLFRIRGDPLRKSFCKHSWKFICSWSNWFDLLQVLLWRVLAVNVLNEWVHWFISIEVSIRENDFRSIPLLFCHIIELTRRARLGVRSIWWWNERFMR